MANDHQHEQGHDHGHLQAQVPQGARTDTDPVCGMTVEVNESTRHADYEGERLHFCSENCETKIYGRLSAWQNWIFQRPNAVGDRGALTLYGHPERPVFDFRRT